MDAALCIVEFKGPEQVIRLAGRYYFDESWKAAQAAFVVNESKRSLGMARSLMSRLVAFAKVRKLKSLWALTGKDKRSLNGIAKKFGFVKGPNQDSDENH
jgi:N-acetylglutamate synthase-like GNAT family acetyltransferase